MKFMRFMRTPIEQDALLQQSRGFNGFFGARGDQRTNQTKSNADMLRTRSTADLYSPRNDISRDGTWNGSQSDLTRYPNESQSNLSRYRSMNGSQTDLNLRYRNLNGSQSDLTRYNDRNGSNSDLSQYKDINRSQSDLTRYRDMNGSSTDLTRYRDINGSQSDLTRYRDMNGSNTDLARYRDINGSQTDLTRSREGKGIRLSSLISMSASSSDLGYISQSSSRRESLGVRNMLLYLSSLK